MLVAFFVCASGECRRKKAFRQNHSCPETLAVILVTTFPDAVEAIAQCHDPCVSRGPFEIFAEVLEDGGVIRRDRGEVIERLVDTGDDAGGSDIVSENAA